jgi:signal transduction histidine kinase/ActR/RegA family two-component response regulator
LRWLTAADAAPLPLRALLSEIAGALGAVAAGIAQLPGGEPIASSETGAEAAPGPWRERPDLLREVTSCPSALAVRDGGAHWLLTTVDGEERASWLLWVQAPAAHGWSPSDAGMLALMGQALARHLRRPAGAPQWARQLLLRRRRQHFDQVATAVRRIAHDYGNVLTGILGFSELGLGQVTRGTSLASYLNEIQRAGQAGERLTNALRLFARREWPRNTPARIAAVVSDEMRRLRGKFPAVQLQVQLPRELPAVAIDPEPLRHALGQLLDNAAEAVAAGGSVRIKARAVALTADQCLDLLGATEAGPHVEIAVEDTGCGLSADARQRLLVEPFFTTRTRHRGYGLCIAYGILAAHRGGLAVEPAACGTVARAVLPVAGSAVAAPASAPAGAASGQRVLVVDDDPMILQLVQTTLQRAGYRVEIAHCAADAFRSFTHAAEPFGLVLSDVVMPHVDGYDLARQLRRHDAGVNLLFMSGQMGTGPARPPSEATTDLLAKPFGPEGLLRAVRSALERSAARLPSADGNGDEAVLSPAR